MFDLWIPRIGWQPMSYGIQVEYDFNLNYKWEVWGITWLGYALYFKYRRLP